MPEFGRPNSNHEAEESGPSEHEGFSLDAIERVIGALGLRVRVSAGRAWAPAAA